MIGAVTHFMSAGDALDKMSGRVGTSVEFLSALSHAAAIGGTDINTLENGIKRLARSAYDAGNGSKEASDAFAELGVSATDGNGNLKETEQLFRESVGALGNVENATKKAALAQVLFGRAGTKMLPMLKDGADGMNAVMEEAKALGLVMSTEDATAAAELTDSWTRLVSIFKSSIFFIGGQLAPMLTDLADRVKVIGPPIIDWIKNNRELIVTVFKVGAGIMAAGAALLTLGSLLIFGGAALGGLATLAVTAGSMITGLAGIVMAFVSPIGAVVIALAGLATWFVTSTDTGAAALAWLGDAFGGLKNRALASFGAIGKAMAGGELKLAAKVLWLALKAEWIKGTAFIMEEWATITTGFKIMIADFNASAATAFTNMWAGLESGFVHSTDFLADVWSIFAGGLMKTWHSTIGFISKAWTQLKGLFDSDINVDAEVKRINAETDQKNQGVDAARDKEIFGRDQKRQDKLSGIEKQRSGTIDEINAQNEREKDKLGAGLNENMKANAAAMADAQSEWQAAVDAANATGDAVAVDAKKPGDEDDPSKKNGNNTIAGVAGKSKSVAAIDLFSSEGFSAIAKGLNGGRDTHAQATEKHLAKIKKIAEREERDRKKQKFVVVRPLNLRKAGV